MKWWERLEALRVKAGWSAIELSKRSGVPYESVAKYTQGRVEKPRGKSLEKIASALGVTEQFLLYGIATPENLTINDNSINQNGVVRLPLISLSDLARHQEGHDLMSVWDGEMSVVVADDVGPLSVVTTVEDNSMLPDFRPGDRVVCDPEASIEPGKFVLAKVDNSGKALFRRYRLSKIGANGIPSVELKPLNEDYPTYSIDAEHTGHIIGRCTHHIKRI
jgi:transcriptional regulator with XRE-family HTH domain